MANPQYYIDNREQVKARSRAYYQANKEKMKEQKRKTSHALYHQKKTGVDFRITQLIRGAKARSKNQEVPFDIDFDYVKELWERSDGHCLISGKAFDLSPSDTYQNKNAPSLDKIEPSKGYVKGNVRLVTWHVNAAILNFGLDTFITLCKDVLENIKETNA